MNWLEFIWAIEKNFPDLHREINERIGIKKHTEYCHYTLRGCADYNKEFIIMTGCDMDTYTHNYSDVVNWVLELKKKNEMIEYVWLL